MLPRRRMPDISLFVRSAEVRQTVIRYTARGDDVPVDTQRRAGVTRANVRLLAGALTVLPSVSPRPSSQAPDGPSSTPAASGSTTTTSPPSSASSAPSVDPRARPAVTAYLNFWVTVHRAY